MKNNKIIGAVALFVVALVAIVCALVYKYVDGNKNKEETTTPATVEAVADITEAVTEYFEVPTAAQAVTEPSGESTTKQSETTVTAPSDAVTELSSIAVTKPSATVNTEFNKVFKMPVAPQYVEPDVNVDFDTAKVLSYKYDPDGGYFYTDDKSCWQQNFGFNEGYDSMAPLGMMNYDTVRVKFVYDNQECLIQMWKGQYGYAFVGGEIGLYNRTVLSL